MTLREHGKLISLIRHNVDDVMVARNVQSTSFTSAMSDIEALYGWSSWDCGHTADAVQLKT